MQRTDRGLSFSNLLARILHAVGSVLLVVQNKLQPIPPRGPADCSLLIACLILWVFTFELEKDKQNLQPVTRALEIIASIFILNAWI